MVKLEVCIDSLESAENAIAGGADELEVCSCLIEGGFTPSIGLVREVIRMRNDDMRIQKKKTKTKINVMIRCRSGSNFCYSYQEMVTMLSDIEFFKQLDVDSFVFGALKNSFEVDIDNCQKIIDKANPIPVSFHRAFDVCKDPDASIRIIIGLGIQRLLTSGLKDTVEDTAAREMIGYLVREYGNEIEIMPGSGITEDNVEYFVHINCQIVHSSCKVIKHLQCGDIKMGSSDIYLTTMEAVKNLKACIHEASL